MGSATSTANLLRGCVTEIGNLIQFQRAEQTNRAVLESRWRGVSAFNSFVAAYENLCFDLLHVHFWLPVLQHLMEICQELQSHVKQLHKITAPPPALESLLASVVYIVHQLDVYHQRHEKFLFEQQQQQHPAAQASAPVAADASSPPSSPSSPIPATSSLSSAMSSLVRLLSHTHSLCGKLERRFGRDWIERQQKADEFSPASVRPDIVSLVHSIPLSLVQEVDDDDDDDDEGGASRFPLPHHLLAQELGDRLMSSSPTAASSPLTLHFPSPKNKKNKKTKNKASKNKQVASQTAADSSSSSASASSSSFSPVSSPHHGNSNTPPMSHQGSFRHPGQQQPPQSMLHEEPVPGII